MINEVDKIGNTGKSFDLIVDGTIRSIVCKELTIAELAKTRELFIDTIKTENRKEAIELSKLMDEKDRTKYLIEVAKNTAVIPEEKITAVFDSVFGLIEILKIASSDSKLNWEQIFQDNTDKCLEIYIFALGILTKSEEDQEQKFCRS